MLMLGNGAKRLSLISLDLSGADEALSVARKIAEQTGYSVIVWDAEGELLDMISAPAAN